MRPQFLSAALTALALASCYSPGDGQAPPLDGVYFPTGLALDTSVNNAQGEPRYLYVASSDFDLRYRSSSLLAYDLDKARAKIPRSCNADPECQIFDENSVCDTVASNANGGIPSYFCLASKDAGPCAKGNNNDADRLLYPGRCKAIVPSESDLIHDTVGIGAFATDVILQQTPGFQPRLFLPVRGDGTLHWIDLEDGKFQCGQASTGDGSCDSRHRAGRDPAVSNDQLTLPAEPFAIATTQSGNYVAITNQTTGNVSLFTNVPATSTDWANSTPPGLVAVVGNLPQAPVAIVALPDENPILLAGRTPDPGFLVAYRNAAQIDLLRVREQAPDPSISAASYTRVALVVAGSAAIGTNSLGFDSRDIVIDDTQRQADYAKCPSGDTDCLRSAHRSDIYVANRAPSSLLVGQMTADFSFATGSNDLPSFSDPVALTSGPSRVVLGKVKVSPDPLHAHDTVDDRVHNQHDDLGKRDPAYDFETRLFIVCFDSRRIFVYDPKRRVIEAIVGTGRGPFALAVDDRRGLAYVAHFTDSYLGVVSLDQRYPQTYAAMIASIGVPSPPRTSK